MRTILFTVLFTVSLLAAPVGGHAAVASVYGGADGYCGSRMAGGGRLDCSAMTAAHRTLPFGTWVRVTLGGRSVTVRITDRGPFVRGREIDLTPAAAKRIACPGVCRVTLEVVPKPFIPTTRSGWGNF